MRHSVSTELLNSILQYLQTRPFAEVHQMIATLQKDAQVIEEVKEETAEDEVDG